LTVIAPSVLDIGSGGRRLRVLRLGHGPRLIALHGGPGLDHHVLVPLALPLAERFTVWRPDLPGHGANPPARGDRPGLRKTLDDLKRWLLGLPEGIDVLLGHSLGAWLAQELLRSGQLRPRAAVLLAPLAGDRERTGDRRRATYRRRRRGRADGRAELLAHVESEIAGELPAAFVKTVAPALIRPASDYPELLGELSAELEKPTRSLDPGCPVLVVGGELDRTTPPDAVQRVALSIAGSEVAILDGMGHYPFVEPESRVADVIRAFLDRVA
jgi:pimeloyl-ACP methyl ester carboxylesterase